VTAERDKWQDKSDELKKQYDDHMKKHKGHVAIYIPWWLIIIAMIAVAGSCAQQIKTGIIQSTIHIQIINLKNKSMKKLLMFSLVVMFLVSCGGKGQAPTDYITLGQAFGVVSHTFSYWLWLVVCAILFVAVGLYDDPGLPGRSGMVRRVQCCFFYNYSAVTVCNFYQALRDRSNTTVEQLHRGGIIGY
jgi:hypothetical protein